MQKEIAINILQDIYDSLQGYDWKDKGLKTIKIYRRNLEMSTDKEIQQLIEKQKEYIEKYGEDSIKTKRLNKRVDKKIREINNK